MNDASDISSLYQRFGGDADQYLELGQSNHVQASRERWPLLSAIRPELAMVPPAVGERVEATHAVSPWASVAPVAAPPVPPIPLAAAVRVEPWLAPPVAAPQPEPPAPSTAVTQAMAVMQRAADSFAAAPHLPVPSVPAAPSTPAVTPASVTPATPAPAMPPQAAAPAAPVTPSAEPRPSLQNVFARLAQSGSSSSKP